MDLAKAKRLIRQWRQADATRINRYGAPNGFFFNGLIWYGDACSEQTAIARGFIIEPDEMDGMDEPAKEEVADRLRYVLRSLGKEYQAQIKRGVGNDYSDVLERYRADTDAIEDKFRFRWQIWNRAERYTRYSQAMAEGKLKRERLTLYISRVIDSQPSFSVSEDSLAKHFESMAQREAEAFAEIQGDLLNSTFPDCRIVPMTDRDHYAEYYKFLNPGLAKSPFHGVHFAQHWFDESLSIQENCLFGDIVQPPIAGISFQYDGMNHAILVMRELPSMIEAGMITRVANLGFQNYEMTINIYPQTTQSVVKSFKQNTAQLKGEVKTRPKDEEELGEELLQGQRRIVELVRGEVHPFDALVTLRLWDKDPDVVISRATIAKNAFLLMGGAPTHHATCAETARQLWFNTWPGWTWSKYRDYDLKTDDHTAAELIPWSSSFTGKLETAEAIYDSATGGLVGLTTQVGKTSQNMLVFGIVGAGKSIELADLWGQIGHQFACALIVEEGNSHGTTAMTAGGKPIIVTPNSKVTINYLDPNGLPITNEQIGSAVALCLKMLRETDPARISVIQSILTQHINLLYDAAWEEWSAHHPEIARIVEHRAYLIHRNLKDGQSFLDGWKDDQEHPALWSEGEENDVSFFATHYETRGMVRDLGFVEMSEMPTHSELVELLTLTPIGGQDNKEAIAIGDRLATWKYDGPYGCLFDGKTTVRLDGDMVHFELGLIDKSKDELRDAAHFLAMTVIRQQVVKRPRAERKFVLFEEGARLIELPGGAQMLKEFYSQMRKYNAVVCTVFQQVAALKHADPTVRAAVMDNTKLFLVSAQPSPGAADDIAEVLELSAAATNAIKRYALPENQDKKFSSFLMVAPDPRRKLVGTLRNIATPEMVYCGASDNEIFDSRAKALAGYSDIVAGILEEARK